MNRIYFLVNDESEALLMRRAVKKRKGLTAEIGTVFPDNPCQYALIIPWAYQRIIRELPDPNRVLIFHSTDLPKGKGWAPIYNTIVNKEHYYTICGILASDRVDAGDIVIQARFRMKPAYTAEKIREWDLDISLRLIRCVLMKFARSPVRGRP